MITGTGMMAVNYIPSAVQGSQDYIEYQITPAMTAVGFFVIVLIPLSIDIDRVDYSRPYISSDWIFHRQYHGQQFIPASL